MMSSRARLVLFDLDGTLVHSAPDIAHAANQALADVGHPLRPIAEICDFIGHGAERLIHRCLTGTRDDDADSALHQTTYLGFQRHYAACLNAQTQLYAGVVETLDTLAGHGILLGCVTNKPAKFTLPLLERMALTPYFAVILSGDSLPTKKPDPAPLRRAAADCGVSNADTVMVGDSMADLTAARAASMRIFCVSYGYSAGIDLTGYKPDAYVAQIKDILPHLIG